MASGACRRLRIAADFVRVGRDYWLGIYPQVARELARWQQHAAAIPDPTLRRHAVAAHRGKRAHAEGAAAFAVTAPRAARPTVVRCLVAFQAMYDYLDTVSEQPGADPFANGWQLHSALVDALDPGAPRGDPYSLHPQRDDGGYLAAFVDTCRSACSALPAFSVVAPTVRLAARRAMTSQGFNHAITLSPSSLHSDAVARWATAEGAERLGLSWWEVVGATGSSLAILALVAAAADPMLDANGCEAIHAVYFPWAGAVLALIDSLIDQAHDSTTGTHSLVSHYPAPHVTADRLAMLTTRALALTQSTPEPRQHALIVASMVALFASAPEARSAEARHAIRSVVTATGPRGSLPLLALRAKRRIDSVVHRL